MVPVSTAFLADFFMNKESLGIRLWQLGEMPTGLTA
jgi:hypothetical protein